jgi:hypothetical protein
VSPFVAPKEKTQHYRLFSQAFIADPRWGHFYKVLPNSRDVGRFLYQTPTSGTIS